jgi:hypothetical protein
MCSRLNQLSLVEKLSLALRKETVPYQYFGSSADGVEPMRLILTDFQEKGPTMKIVVLFFLRFKRFLKISYSA